MNKLFSIIRTINSCKITLLVTLVLLGGCNSPIRFFNYDKIKSSNLCLQLSREAKKIQKVNFLQNNKEFEGRHYATYALPAFIDQTCDILDEQAVITNVDLGVSFALDKDDSSKEYLFYDFEVSIDFPKIGGGIDKKVFKTRSHMWIYPDEYKKINLRGAIQKHSSEALIIGFENIINQIKEELESSEE